MRDRKRRESAAGRDIPIADPADPERRARAQREIFYFLTTYFPNSFTDPFTEDQREMIRAIMYRAQHGGDQAVAAPRGAGKTTLAEKTIIACIVTGILSFPLLVAATGPDAKRLLQNIKHEFESNDLLAADFPEVCAPIHALEGAPQRANMQTVGGARTNLKWADDYVIFPTVKGSKASGAVLSARGLDAAIRGVRYRNQRPDFVLIDDAETRESVESMMQTRKRELIIEQDLAGVGGPGKRIARVMLTTIMRPHCLSAKYTDPKQKPSWAGKRLRLIDRMPEREDLWAEYVRLRQVGMEGGDKDAREAHRFYLTHRAEMDANAVLTAPDRYIKSPLDDGEPAEVSALQHCFNIIADRGPEHFATEYQNDPPEEAGPESSGVTANMVASRINGLPRGIVPEQTQVLTAFIDCGKRQLHWLVAAWRNPGMGWVVDYGTHEIPDADVIGTEKALGNALRARRDAWMAAPYETESGQDKRIDLCMVDAGTWDTTIYQFVQDAGMPFRASKGFGAGPQQSPFRTPSEPTLKKRVGEHWFDARQPSGVWLIGMDADYWKRWVHDRFATEPRDEAGQPRPGSLTVFGHDVRDHVIFGQHVTAEVEVEEFVPDKGMKRYWKVNSRNNHWFDCMYGAAVGANGLGIKLSAQAPAFVPRRAPRRVTAPASSFLPVDRPVFR